MTSKKYHIPVLLKECIDGLNINPEGIYVDVTFGGGGHSYCITEKLSTGKLYAFDQDEDAKANIVESKNLIFIQSNFRYIKNFLKLYGVLSIDGLIADLGISSHQIDHPERGFSTRYEGDLDMRMHKTASLSAKQLINEYSIENLKRIFKLYGELDNAYSIAKAIETSRSEKEITTTQELIDVIKPFAKRNQEFKFYAQVFQALRIEVNDELEALKKLLEQANQLLKPGGRLVVLTYHSLEDRLVKNFIKSGNVEGELEKDFYGNVISPLEAVNRKIITASEEEISINNRARSAKLRIAEKI